MSSYPATATYSGSSFADDYWLVMEQVGVEDDVATVAEVATAIDALYDLDPCVDDSALVGGEAVQTDEEGSVEAPVEQVDYWAYINGLLSISDCDEEDFRTEQVKVYRSHLDEPYKLVITGGEQTEIVQEEGTETVTVSVSGSSVSLDRVISLASYAWSTVRDLTGAIVAPPAISVSGDGLVFAYPVVALLQLTYSTGYDLVTLEIPNQDDGSPGECSLLAFYHGAAYALDLDEPETDDSVSTVANLLCPESYSGGLLEISGEPYCYERVTNYYKCACSRSWAPEYDVVTEVAVICPDDIRHDGRYCLGYRSSLAGFVDCGEYDAALSSVDFYNAACCTRLDSAPQLCRDRYTVYRGTQGVEYGTQHYIDLYGPGVRFEPVGPSDGVCGELHVEITVNNLACCEDVVALSPDPGNPVEIAPGDGEWMRVDNGRDSNIDEWIWTASGGLTFVNGMASIVGGRKQQVFAPVSFCEGSFVEVDDSCSVLTMALKNSVPSPLSIPGADRVVAPEGFVYVSADGGVAPYFWAGSGGLALISGQGLSNATFEAAADFCGTGTVTVSDSCTSVATAGIRSTEGHWTQDPAYTVGVQYCEAFGGETSEGGVLTGNGRECHVGITSGNDDCGGNTGVCEPGNLIAEGDGLLSPGDHCLYLMPDAGGTGWFNVWQDDCCSRYYRAPDGSEQLMYPLMGFAQIANNFKLWECA